MQKEQHKKEQLCTDSRQIALRAAVYYLGVSEWAETLWCRGLCRKRVFFCMLNSLISLKWRLSIQNS